MADQIENMHDRFNGDLDVKIDEIHRAMLLLQSSATSSPIISSSRPGGSISLPRLPEIELPKGPPEELLKDNRNYEKALSRKTSDAQTSQMTPELTDSEFSAQSPQSIDRYEKRCSVDPRESAILPLEYQYHIKDQQLGLERGRQPSDTSIQSISPINTTAMSAPAGNDQIPDKFLDMLSSSPSNLPPPMMNSGPGTSDTLIGYGDFLESQTRNFKTCHQSRSSITITQHDDFKKSLYDNAAVLCEV